MKFPSLFGAFWFAATALSGYGQLKTAIEVRSLSFDAAESGQAVDITGVVIFSDPPSTVFLQDETAGAFFRPEGKPPPTPGSIVRVRGVTQPGLYLPGIENTAFEVVGKKGLPEPISVSFDDLASGRFHYQWVAVEGIVRTIESSGEGTAVVNVSLGSRAIEIHVESPPSEAIKLIDSRVRVTGLAAGQINERRQLVAPYLRSQNWSDFEMLTPAPKLNKIPKISPEKLLTFNIEGVAQHRVQLSGVVLAKFPDGLIYLRDGDTAVRVRLLNEDENLNVGSQIQVVGFAEMDRFSASLADCNVIEISPAESTPAPVSVGFLDLREGSYDSNLISITGILSDSYRNENGGVLVLRSGNRTLHANFPNLIEGLTLGAEVTVTGICVIESARGSQYLSTPDIVSIRMRSADDVKILRTPSWWTPQKLGLALAGLGVMVLLGLLWIVLLKKQVHRQTGTLREKIENEAALEERQRLAREFHDTLEQDLTGLSLRLDAVTALPGKDEKVNSFLVASRNLVGRIQTETRNLVADLRHSRDGTANLATALQELVGDLPKDVGPEIILEFEDLEPMPARTVHHLKMIIREAITNALKHAAAGRIAIKVARNKAGLKITVVDDGRGFDPEAETHGTAGHFGCMGIRERARKLNLDVAWHCDEGTTLTVLLPKT